MNNQKKQGIKAFRWDFMGRLANQGVGFVVTVFLARLLEPSDFGLVAMVMVIIGMAGVFTNVGLSAALIQRRRVLQIHYSSVFYFNIVVGLGLSLLTYFSSGLIGRFYSNDALVPLAQALAWLFLINAFGSVQTVRLKKSLKNDVIVRCKLGAVILSGTLGIVLAFNSAGVWALVAQSIVFGLTYNVLIWLASQWNPGFGFSFRALRHLWSFGFRMFLAGMLEAVFTRLDYLVIGKIFTPQLLGFYQRAKSLNLLVVRYSSASLMSVLFPYLSIIQKDLPRFQSTVQQSLGIICFIVFCLLGGIYVVSNELILMFFGDKWLPSVEFLEILVISGFAYPVSALLVNVLSSRGKSKEFLHLEIVKKSLEASNLFVLFFLGIRFYLYGLIFTSVFSVMLNAVFAAREIKLRPLCLIKPIVVQASASFIAVLATILLTEGFMQDIILASFFTQGALFLLFYVSINYLLKTQSSVAFANQVLPLVKQRFS